MRKIVLILLGLIIRVYAIGQIVNIESRRIHTDTTGWAGSFGGNFNFSKNVDEIFSTSLFAHLQYKTSRNLYLIYGDYSFLKGAEKKLSDNAFFHLRYNRKLSGLVRWEVFTQLQNNKITKIEKRFLAGTGPRFKVSGADLVYIYIGVLAMFEHERELTDPAVYYNDIRNSDYISITFKPLSNLELISTTFYQPRMDKWSDYRILNQEVVQLSITQKLSLTVNWDFLYDRFPVADIPRSTYSFATGLKFAF